MIKLLKETVAELKKVNFPNKNKLMNDTSVVIGVCVFSTAFIFIIDTILNMLLGVILK